MHRNNHSPMPKSMKNVFSMCNANESNSKYKYKSTCTHDNMSKDKNFLSEECCNHKLFVFLWNDCWNVI